MKILEKATIIASDILTIFEKNPVDIDTFVQSLQHKIEEDKNQFISDPTRKFLGGEIKVSKMNEQLFRIEIFYYIQNNEGEISKLSKDPMDFKKNLLITDEFIGLSKDSITYPIN